MVCGFLLLKTLQNIKDLEYNEDVDTIKNFNTPYVYIFNNEMVNRQCSLEFMIYLDITNSMSKNVKVLQLNSNCTLIEYNNENHSFELVQYSCLGDTKQNIPVKYNKWIRFNVEFVRGSNNEPLLLGIKIDDSIMHNTKLYDMDPRLDKITIGDNSSKNIGFMKNIKIRL